MDAVHAKGSFIYLQIVSLGRNANPDQLRGEDPSFSYWAPSPIGVTGRPETPRAMTVSEIEDHVRLHRTAATNAVFKAGFDGVEIHGATGYLVQQFIEDMSNHRTDRYGGSIENRSRFVLEVIDAIVSAVGANRTAIRFSPWGRLHGMCPVLCASLAMRTDICNRYGNGRPSATVFLYHSANTSKPPSILAYPRH